MLESFIQALLGLVESLNYLGIISLMAIESSFVPFPSELIIPPAGYLAQQGRLNLGLVIGSGILGSLIGALVNYFLALWLGRPILYKLVNIKWAKVCLLNQYKLEKSEKYFLKHGAVSTFFGRLIPVIRQLISLPAGLAKMNLFKFCLFTGLGASVWVIILALVGYYFGAEQETILQYYGELKIIILSALVLIIGLIVVRKRSKKII